jgi:hypothetical protein
MIRESRGAQRQKAGAIRIPFAVLKAVKELVLYCWREEYRDFQSRLPHERAGHVYRSLVVIRRWLKNEGHDIKPGS